jgi:hypothetical protein
VFNKLGDNNVRESTIEKYLVDKVKALGGEVRKVQWIGRNGAPDRLVLRDADSEAAALLRDHGCDDSVLPLEVIARQIVGMYTSWPELKAPGEKAKPHQQREHDRMRAMGQRVVVIDSIEGVEELLS